MSFKYDSPVTVVGLLVAVHTHERQQTHETRVAKLEGAFCCCWT